MADRLIILDRDGVINQDSDHYIKSPDEWFPIQGSAEAIARLNQAGYKIGIATNQSGIARGLFDLDTLQEMHNRMADHLAEFGAHVDQILFCPDHPEMAGPDRKPAPGMALKLLRTFSAKAEETWFVGDSLSDVLSAINAGCRPALVKTGKGLKTINAPEISKYEVPVFADLRDFVNDLLG